MSSEIDAGDDRGPYHQFFAPRRSVRGEPSLVVRAAPRCTSQLCCRDRLPPMWCFSGRRSSRTVLLTFASCFSGRRNSTDPFLRSFRQFAQVSLLLGPHKYFVATSEILSCECSSAPWSLWWRCPCRKFQNKWLQSVDARGGCDAKCPPH